MAPADRYHMGRSSDMTREEASLRGHIVDLENRNKKEDQQRRMAAWAMATMIVVTGFLLSPWVDVERVSALSDLIGMFYIAQAGIIATFFGSSAYVSSKKSDALTETRGEYDSDPNSF